MVDDNSLDRILVLIKQLEATLLGLKQLRDVGQGVGREMLEVHREPSERS